MRTATRTGAQETLTAAILAMAERKSVPARLRGRSGWVHTTQAALLEDALAVVHGLQCQGIRPGEHVALLGLPPADAVPCFLGAVLAGALPVQLHPPLHLGRFDVFRLHVARVLARVDAHALVTTDRLLPLLAGLPIARLLLPADVRGSEAGTPEAASPSAPAFMQLTSGSTSGTPRAIVLSHGAVTANVRSLATRAGLRPDDVGYTWLPLYHDMGLVGCVLMGIAVGMEGIVSSPEQFVRHPLGWLLDMSRFQATSTAAPCFALHLCVEAARRTGIPTDLDLGALRVLICGGEPVEAAVVDRFCKTFAPYGLRRRVIRPVYGLAEACLGVTMTAEGGGRTMSVDRRALALENRFVPAADASARRIHSVGTPLDGITVALVDDEGRRIDDEDRVGAVLVQSPGVMDAYWDDPAATSAALADGWLHTGDLGAFHGRELYITGRAKGVVIVNGRNYNAEDVESLVRELPGVRAHAVAAMECAPDEGRGLLVIAETDCRDPVALREL